MTHRSTVFAALTLGLAFAALAAGLGAAAAEEAAGPDAAAKQAFAGRLFAGKIADKKSYACFVRRYDAAHLARHPLQKVTGMRLLVDSEPGAEGDGRGYNFRMGVTFRDKSGRFESGGSCGVHFDDDKAGTLMLGCGVDCDGGGIGVEMAKGDKDDAVLLKLERVRIWKPDDTSDDDDFQSLSAGADDGTFRLDRVALDECRSLVSDKDERSAMFGKPAQAGKTTIKQAAK